MALIKHKNVGGLDKAVRITFGFVLMGTGVLLHSGLIVAFAFVPVITGTMGYCPLYNVIKLNTHDKN